MGNGCRHRCSFTGSHTPNLLSSEFPELRGPYTIEQCLAHARCLVTVERASVVLVMSSLGVLFPLDIYPIIPIYVQVFSFYLFQASILKDILSPKKDVM